MKKAKKKTPYLDAYLHEYASSRGIRSKSKLQIKYAINALDQWHRKRTRLGDLTEGLINRFIAYSQKRKEPKAVLKQRNDILGLWRQGVQQGILETPPNPYRITEIKLRHKPPVAWTIDEVRELLSVASTWPGTFRDGRSRRDWWGCYLRAKWDTGLRCIDLFQIKWTDLDDRGRITIYQSKTGFPVVRMFHPKTLKALLSIRNDDLIISRATGRRQFWQHFRLLTEACSLDLKQAYASAFFV